MTVQPFTLTEPSQTNCRPCGTALAGQASRQIWLRIDHERENGLAIHERVRASRSTSATGQRNQTQADLLTSGNSRHIPCWSRLSERGS